VQLFCVVTRVIAASGDRKGNVNGLTVCGNELFIVRWECGGFIEVCNATDFSFKRKVKVKELEGVDERVAYDGLTSCAKCLYVSFHCRGDGYIARMELTGDNEVVEWKIVDRWMPYGLGLSVNSNHNLMVACLGQPHKLIEYTTHGYLVRQILLQDGVKWPWHAIQLNSNQFLVSHGHDGGDSLHRVCVVDAKGRVILSYGNERGSATGQLHALRHVAVDKNDFIFVADLGINRIVVLDSTLKWSRDLEIAVAGVGGKRPYSLCLDKRRKLFVGECIDDDSRVIVIR
jgi:hypothetical protein